MPEGMENGWQCQVPNTTQHHLSPSSLHSTCLTLQCGAERGALLLTPAPPAFNRVSPSSGSQAFLLSSTTQVMAPSGVLSGVVQGDRCVGTVCVSVYVYVYMYVYIDLLFLSMYCLYRKALQPKNSWRETPWNN